jgi:hypothetical protein
MIELLLHGPDIWATILNMGYWLAIGAVWLIVGAVKVALFAIDAREARRSARRPR